MKLGQGDLCEATEPFIVHGCNAQGVMGSGVALALRNKWPSVWEKYERWCQFYDTPHQRVGGWSHVQVEPGKWVFNLVTQENYGYNGAKYARYSYIQTGLTEIIQQFVWPLVSPRTLETSFYRIAVPKIGCERGGLKWDFVREILMELEEKFPYIEFNVYEWDK